MPSLHEVVSTLKVSSDTVQKFEVWLYSPDRGWKPTDPVDDAFFTISEEDLVQAGLTRVSPDGDDAARLLGARPWTLARTVHLPLIRPALAGAGLLVFVDCLKELPASLMLRPLNVETLSTYIYQFAARGSFEEGALAALLIVAAGILPVIQIVRQTDAATGPLPTTNPL